MLEVTLDVSIVILLLATIGLGGTVHRRLRRLQHDRGEIATLVASLESAVGRAEAVLGELRRTALEHGERVDRDQHAVARLIEDLTVLSARANRDADRLAEQIQVARDDRLRWCGPGRRARCQASLAADDGGPRTRAEVAAVTRARLLRDRAVIFIGASRRGRWMRLPPVGWRPGALLLAAVGVLAVGKAMILVHELRKPAAPDAPPGAVSPLAIMSDKAQLNGDPLAVEPGAGPARGAEERWATAPASGDAADHAEGSQIPGGVPLRPEDLTESDLALLQDLVARRQALDERESELELREALLDDAEARLAAQLEDLTRLKAAIEDAIGQHGAAEAAELASLVKIYETMKPKAAAEIFNRLEMAVLLEVVSRMREAKASDVLGRMDPKRAKELTAELARRQELPPLPR